MIKKAFLFLFLGALSLSAMADTDKIETVDGINYEFFAGSMQAHVRWAEATTGHLTIPATVSYEGKTYEVTAIQNSAFNDTELSSVTIGANVTDIGQSAFLYARELQTVTFEAGSKLRNIGQYAFENCVKLETFDMPAGVESIGEDAFYLCERLTEAHLPGTLKTIGKYTYRGCTSLATVTIGEGVETIEGLAFYKCPALTDITIPKSVTSIGGSPFTGCTSLTSINVATGNSYYKSIDGILYNTAMTTVLNCPAGKTGSCNIPNGVTEVAAYAFYQSRLSSITLPYTLTTMGQDAFAYCAGLTTMTIPSGLSVVPYEAFYECKKLETLTLSEGVQDIRNGAFGKCVSLKTVNLPSTLTILYYYAFGGCESLETIKVDATSVPTANSGAFDGVPVSQVTLIVPSSAVSAYQAADVWKDFYYDTPGTYAVGDTFTAPTAEGVEVTYIITSLSPKTVSVGDGKNKAVDSKTKGTITIPTKVNGFKVTGISHSGLSGLIYLSSLNLPSTLTTLEPYAFMSLAASSIEIPDGVTAIPNDAFSSATIQSITLPKGIKSIGTMAFRACTKLTSITIPASVETIGAYAFERCNSLLGMMVESSTPIAVHKLAFPTSANVYLYVPKGSKAKYAAADYWKDFKEIIETPDDPSELHIPGQRFTSNTVEGVEVTYVVTSPTTVAVGVDYFTKAINEGVTGTVSIPQQVDGLTVTAINSYAFSFSSISMLHLPHTITSIGDDAISYCNKLSAVVVRAASPIAINANTFADRSKLFLYVPTGSKAAYEAADYWKEFKEIVEFDGDVSEIMPVGETFTEATVEGVEVLYCVTSPNTVQLGVDYDNKAIDKSTVGPVTIPSKVRGHEVTELATFAFASCYYVTAINLPPTITKMGSCSIGWCSRMQSFTIPAGMTTISSSALAYCRARHIDIPATVTSVADDAFKDCDKLTYVTVNGTSPATLTELSFPTRASVKAYVPTGSKATYEAADYWKDFQAIVEMQEGDANGDETVTITDAVTVVDHILGNSPDVFIPQSADTNKDGTVNITDAVGIVDIILNATE